MAIKVNWQDLQARYINGQSIGKVMLNWQQIRPEATPPTPPASERISVTIRAIRSGSYYYISIPTTWKYNGSYASYNWNISVDSWTAVNYQWTAGSYWSIGIVVGSWNHSVVIRPVTATYWRASAFSYAEADSDTCGSLRSIGYDRSYMWYALSSTHTGDNFRYKQYAGCINLNSAYNRDELPDTVTTIGDNFRAGQYRGCTSILSAGQENMPNSVTTIWDNFREEQFFYCTTLTGTFDESMSSNVTSIWDNFRSEQFRACSNINTAWAESLPNGLLTIWDWFRSWQYMSTALTTAPAESLPDTVTSIGSYYRDAQYSHAPITTISWIKDVNMNITWYRGDQFTGIGSPITITTLGDVWQWWWLYAYADVTQVNVPSQYLSNYQNSQVQPWIDINPNLFVWY